MEIASGKKKKKLIFFLNNFFFFFKSVRIASYVRKPVKTVKIRKTHVKNVQVDTSAVADVYDATMIAHFVDIMSILLSLTKVKMAFVHLLCYLIRLYSNKTHR